MRWHGYVIQQEKKQQEIAYFNTLFFVFKKVLTVHPATGKPDDDGYLTNSAAQSTIASQVSPLAYRDMYALYINNPEYYDIPRLWKIGLRWIL